MSPVECPRCHLPQEDHAWQCDGCGYELTQDFEGARSKLRSQLASARIAFWVMLAVDCGIVGGTIYLATHGFIVISVPLVLAALGFTVKTARRLSVLREQLLLLDRRHVPLPQATVRG